MVEATLAVRNFLYRRINLKAAVNLTIFAVCAAGSLAVLVLLSLLVGADPVNILGTLIQGAIGSPTAISATLHETVPIALTALAFYIPYRIGFFNIGAVGQLEVGALAAMLIVTTVSAPPVLTIVMAFAAASLAGALLILPSLLLKTWRGASEVTTTIMVNFIAVEFVLAMVNGPMKDANAFYGTTEVVPDAFRLPENMLLGVWLTVAILFLAQWVLGRTTFGLRLDAVGGNPVSAAAAGIRVKGVLFPAIIVSGAIAGFAGGIQALGVVHQVAEGWSRPWGFIGILTALLGGTPVGIAVAALVLAGLETGGRHMQAMTGVPAAMIYVLQGIPVLFYLGLRATPYVRRLLRNQVTQ